MHGTLAYLKVCLHHFSINTHPDSFLLALTLGTPLTGEEWEVFLDVFFQFFNGSPHAYVLLVGEDDETLATMASAVISLACFINCNEGLECVELIFDHYHTEVRDLNSKPHTAARQL